MALDACRIGVEPGCYVFALLCAGHFCARASADTLMTSTDCPLGNVWRASMDEWAFLVDRCVEEGIELLSRHHRLRNLPAE